MNPAVPEIGFENGKPVRLFWPEQFRPREQLSAGTVRAAEIRMIALRFLCGLEPQSMADVARQRGVSRNAISAAFRRLARGAGFECYLRKPAETRRKLSEVTRARWAERKNLRAAQSPEVPMKNSATSISDGEVTTS